MIVQAQGLHVLDAEGRRHLDAVSGAFCMQLGYTRPDLVRVMAEAAERLPFARRAAFENPEAVEYELEFLAAAGEPFTRAYLTSSGSEAVDLALKAAYRYQCAAGCQERRGFAWQPGHYHGATLGALGVTGWAPRRGPYEGLLGEARGAGVASPGAGPPPLIGDAPPAARILETIPAAGLGAPLPPPGALARLRAECDADGALWIADEVLTGFGRCGALFAWQRLAEREEDSGAAPDLVVFGKGAGAGFAALAGVLVSGRVAEALDSLPSGERFTHFQTYGGNPVACAVGRRVLAALVEEDLCARVRGLEGGFHRALEPVAAHRQAFEVRGLGFLWGVTLAADRTTCEPHAPEARVAERVEEACRARGLLIYAARGWADGVRGDFLLLAPPLVAGPEVLPEIGAGVAAALRDVLGD